MNTFLIALAILAALACVACTLTMVAMVAVTWKLYDMMKEGNTDDEEELI